VEKPVTRPDPVQVVHFTHVEHLAAIAEHGLLSDTLAQERGLLTTEVGNRGIKEQRRQRAVPRGRGGVVADYVPFYFAPRSPMMYAIIMGQVPEYKQGADPLVYLVTTVAQLTDTGCGIVITDRNAVLGLAAFSDDMTDLDRLIDWKLMEAIYWHDTPAEPDRRERRMAECLAHDHVPWQAFSEVVVKTDARAAEARAALGAKSVTTPVHTRPDWYF
jgi:hypothetical protein